MDQSKVVEILTNILTQLSLTEDQIKIVCEEGDNINVSLTLPTDSAGIFVGHHGEGLTAIRMIFSLILFQRFNLWPKIHLNVNDYQERREDALRELASGAAERAVSLGKEIILPNLSSYERRIVHMLLSENNQVKTESRGIAPFRQMVIIPLS
jgi:spoIIIJ-associated protein